MYLELSSRAMSTVVKNHLSCIFVFIPITNQIKKLSLNILMKISMFLLINYVSQLRMMKI